MTANQIAFAKLLEDKRSNRAQEGLTSSAQSEVKRHNLATEQNEIGKLQETTRHNLAGESETNRHNLATESVERGKLSESVRHNTATESISAGQLQETIRHNVAGEAETNRHNVASESETQRHNYVGEQQAAKGLDLDFRSMIENLKLAEERNLIDAQKAIAALQDAQTRSQSAKYGSYADKANAAVSGSQVKLNEARVKEISTQLKLDLQKLALAYRKQDWDETMDIVNSINNYIKTILGGAADAAKSLITLGGH